MLIQTPEHIEALDWAKTGELMPAIVQDSFDGRVLMQAFVNRAALEKTLGSGKVTFFSRSRQQLWTKGETSGNTLQLVAIHADCDRDSLLILASPAGPTCHRNVETCWDEEDAAVYPGLGFIAELERVIEGRRQERPEGSYTTRLFDAGTKRIAQKVGEEGVEAALAATSGDIEELRNESADLLYHLLVLLRDSDLSLAEVIDTLKSRHG